MSRFGHTKRAKEIKRKARRQAKEARKRKRREESHSGAPMDESGEDASLYEAMTGAGPLTPAEVAERSGMAEPHVHGWLIAQVAAGCASYDPTSDRYELLEEPPVAADDEAGEEHSPGDSTSPADD